MSLFNDFEVTASLFLPSDSDSAKKTIWNYSVVNFTISINIIQLSPEERVIFQEEMADFKANVDGANASNLVKGCRIGVGSVLYEVTNEPLARKLFPGTYTVRLRRLDQ